ncbi:MAG: DnaJ domain-containing protein [Anaerolineales bacterium]|nr:DnaJ domain-containing protein [Anaerolineales bacterium]
MPVPDPYRVLGLTPNATTDEIRAAYRRLAAQIHPDTQPADRKDWAAEQMRTLNAARDLLLDAERRAAYDACFRRPTYDGNPWAYSRPQPGAETEDFTRRPPHEWSDAELVGYLSRRLRRLLITVTLWGTLLAVIGLGVLAPAWLVALGRFLWLAFSFIFTFGSYLLALLFITFLLALIVYSARRIQ